MSLTDARLGTRPDRSPRQASQTAYAGDRRRVDLFGMPGAEGLPEIDRRRPASTWPTRLQWPLVAALVLALALWTVGILLADWPRIIVYSSTGQTSLETGAALAKLFGALVLFLFPARERGYRLPWVAAGLLVLGLGTLIFGVVELAHGTPLGLNTSMYLSLTTRVLAGALFAVGLIPRRAPALSRRNVALVSVGLFALLSLLVALLAGHLPVLTHVADASAAATRRGAFMPGLSPWHFGLLIVPLALVLVSTVFTALRFRDRPLGAWLLIAMILLSATQLHLLFWPSAYTPIFTSADALRMAFAGVVALGGVLELRRITAQRALLLAAEQDRVRRLEELTVLKADFTRMVAHELMSPLAAIRGWADIMSMNGTDDKVRAQAAASIRADVDALMDMVADVRAAGRAEREDFAIRAHPVHLDDILHDAEVYAQTLPGAHPLEAATMNGAVVWADPERIVQVLRNLLNNAATYSPPGTPIGLWARARDRSVVIEVTDRGPGIPPQEQAGIFEAFTRGRDTDAQAIPGAGVGLYLSRRLIEAHGSDLAVHSRPDGGSIFSFELEMFA